MKKTAFYFNVIRIRLFGTKEEREDERRVRDLYNNMIIGYMEKEGLKSKRKAERQLINSLEFSAQKARKKREEQRKLWRRGNV
jgi:hypothetical protein